MHFSGRTWRPPYEAASAVIELTSGCSYHRCSFCGLYREEPFRVSPLEQFEKDLKEISERQPNVRRIFLTGGNPFALSYERLLPYLSLIREQLIKCGTIAMFASIRDIKNKELWQLKRLRAMGVNGLTIGTESGEDKTLLLAGKGYMAQDILEQCRKLDEAGIEYYLVYMTGLAGKEAGEKNAESSARLFSRLNPFFISVDSLTLFPGTALYDRAAQGLFSPAGEKERLLELQTFVFHLQLRVHLFADSKSNYFPVSAFLPQEREALLKKLQSVIDTADESEMQAYRCGLKTLG